MKKQSTESTIRILKTGSCQTVSGKSTLTYQIGCNDGGDILMRIYANTAAGFVNPEWVLFKSIDDALSQAGSHFTSIVLLPLFQGKSQNNPAFLLAVLLREGLVAMAADKKRCYEKLDAGRYIAEINALIDSKLSLNADEKPANPAKNSLNADEKPTKPLKKKASSKTASDKKSGEQDSPR